MSILSIPLRVGSPPLARGTVDYFLLAAQYIGITPACAGNRMLTIENVEIFGDHPRLRGEQRMDIHRRRRRGGSPPLARGTVARGRGKNKKRGITPACAGNSKALALCARITGDHPRLRGEQYTALPLATRILGSPPLARGTDKLMLDYNVKYRITPACAGNSALCFIFPPARRDHPRLRGEQYAVDYYTKTVPGSPPLARGTVFCISGVLVHRRITPACAGNSPIIDGRQAEA